MSDYGLWRAIGGATEWKSSGPARALKTIDYAHHEIHDGRHYIVNTSATKNNGEKLDVLMTTPGARHMHYVAEFYGSGAFTMKFYENPTVALTSYASLTAYNNNRNSTNTANMIAGTLSSTDVSSVGTLLHQATISGGVGGRTGGTAGSRAEFILKQSEQYLVEITSSANGNVILFDALWYEEST